jgi:hypothetical protein
LKAVAVNLEMTSVRHHPSICAFMHQSKPHMTLDPLQTTLEYLQTICLALANFSGAVCRTHRTYVLRSTAGLEILTTLCRDELCFRQLVDWGKRSNCTSFLLKLKRNGRKSSSFNLAPALCCMFPTVTARNNHDSAPCRGEGRTIRKTRSGVFYDDRQFTTCSFVTVVDR